MPKKRRLIYGIYPRSFLDAKDSAYKAIRRASEKFSTLDPDFVWMNPIFDSAGADGGYDIVDYFMLDPAFGTHVEFLNLINEGPLAGKVLMDVVLNHVSTKSQLFRRDLTRCARANCLWLDEPLNWDSLFGGPAWCYNEKRGQYYLHLFTEGQADLDLTNQKVIRYLRSALKYWSRQGVAGFRVDTCNILSKELKDGGPSQGLPVGFERYHQFGSPEILRQIFWGLRKDKCFTVGETVGASLADLRDLTGPLSCCFNAEVNDALDGLFLTPGALREPDYENWFRTLIAWIEQSPRFCLQLESHDFARSVSRWRADPRALAILQFALPVDYICLYQGQELGMENLPGEPMTSREHCRIPSEQIFGASYDAALADPDSLLALYRRLIELWKTDEVLLYGKLEDCEIEGSRISFRRSYRGRSIGVEVDLSRPGQSFMAEGSSIIAR